MNLLSDAPAHLLTLSIFILCLFFNVVFFNMTFSLTGNQTQGHMDGFYFEDREIGGLLARPLCARAVPVAAGRGLF